jgi:16S rRNA (guanine966-N2)-methyltransferase
MRIRIVTGTYGGRFIESPDTSTTHPMSERMRGALFNILGDIEGLSVLDPFAGSGAISFEALSRGASQVVAVERDKKAQETILANAKTLAVGEEFKLVRANCRAWSDTKPSEKFDIVICDPPYNDIKLSTVSLMATHLKPNGLMVLSHPGRESAPTVNGVVVVDNRKYGDAALAIYRSEES